ncbi:alpha/beta hydrolase [Streptomyces fragilis]|uniref:Alpha/beta fold hydrolase n=1 Tax=Streptomyces fragilis TaxID=67301 RepID=A0ABV2YFH9_9ACTN|nr:alpha/beta fold hydrolase [Streptomyces fragilis]
MTPHTALPVPSSPARRVLLDAGGVELSGLLAVPRGRPRATVVALHGGGMSAGYFDGPAHPDLSLLRLGAELGYTVLAVDRPGYGHSAAALPEGQSLAEQATTLNHLLRDFAAHHDIGAGYFLLAHSYGGKLALTAAAAADPSRLLGLDISGCGHRYATPPRRSSARGGDWKRNWGPLSLYPPGTFRASTELVRPMPAREWTEAARWPEVFPTVAAGVRVPVRFTFAEHEYWWRHDDEAVADLVAHLAPAHTVVDRAARAGHNISLGWAARAYHLKALAFLESCLLPGTDGIRPDAARVPEPARA